MIVNVEQLRAMVTMVGIVHHPVIHVLNNLKHVQILMEPLPMAQHVFVVQQHSVHLVPGSIAQQQAILAAVVLLVLMTVVLRKIPSIVHVVHLRAMPILAGIVMLQYMNVQLQHILLVQSLMVQQSILAHVNVVRQCVQNLLD